MARLVRAEVVDPAECAAFHYISRTVRWAFLCGHDSTSGKDYEHRRGWVEMRIEFLAGQFGIDVLSFAVMSNHLHLVRENERAGRLAETVKLKVESSCLVVWQALVRVSALSRFSASQFQARI